MVIRKFFLLFPSFSIIVNYRAINPYGIKITRIISPDSIKPVGGAAVLLIPRFTIITQYLSERADSKNMIFTKSPHTA